MVFLPQDPAQRAECEAVFARIAAEEGQPVLGWRTIPTSNVTLGATALVSEPFMVCVPHFHPCATRQRMALKALSNDDFVLFSRSASPSYYETVLSLCAASGFTPSIRHEVRHWLTVASLVSQGLGVSIVPACLSRSGLTGASFVQFPHETRSVTQLIVSRRHVTALHHAAVSLMCEHFGIAPEGP